MLDKCEEEGHMFTWMSYVRDERPPSGVYPCDGCGLKRTIKKSINGD